MINGAEMCLCVQIECVYLSVQCSAVHSSLLTVHVLVCTNWMQLLQRQCNNRFPFGSTKMLLLFAFNVTHLWIVGTNFSSCVCALCILE